MLFSDIVGQEEIKDKLRKAVLSDRIPHAQIIYGPPGSGSLPLALALAQYVACTGPRDSDPCGVCLACTKFSKFIHPDLHFTFPVNITQRISKDPCSDDFIADWREFLLKNPYFDENSWYNHIGIENKQGLISKKDADMILKKLYLKPYESEYKILVLWLPEKMNAYAANHLLKLIEEPPMNTIFLLVSNFPDQVLPTILSRTLPVKLSVTGKEMMSAHLEKKYNLPSDQAISIARLANGNFIRALDIINSSEENESNLEKFVTLMRHSWSREYLGLNQWVEEMATLGRERLKSFFYYSLGQVRENFLANTGEKRLIYLSEKELEFSERFHPYINGKNIVKIYEGMNKALMDIERNGYIKLVLFSFVLQIIKVIRK